MKAVEAMPHYYEAGVPVGCCLRCGRVQTFDGHVLQDQLLEHLHYYFHHYGPPWRQLPFWQRPGDGP